jgi:hypothetical protein
MTYNCSDSLICGINCASDASIDNSKTKIIPFNNYGSNYLRIRTCLYKVQQQQLSRYTTVQQVFCSSINEFEVCSRWIPPSTYVPVALPIETTYIEIDSCSITTNGGETVYSCPPMNQAQRVYGNSFLFPTSFQINPTNTSICKTDGIPPIFNPFQLNLFLHLVDDCLGSFCDFHFHPSICSPKTIQQVGIYVTFDCEQFNFL